MFASDTIYLWLWVDSTVRCLDIYMRDKPQQNDPSLDCKSRPGKYANQCSWQVVRQSRQSLQRYVCKYTQYIYIYMSFTAVVEQSLLASSEQTSISFCSCLSALSLSVWLSFSLYLPSWCHFLRRLLLHCISICCPLCRRKLSCNCKKEIYL